MKVAIVYNRESKAVINLFGLLNREKYGLETIKKIKDAVRACGHKVKTFEGDKNIITNLEEFMPAVISGERPGLVINLSYGIQGRSRYTHIPGILEMLGIPYIGSDPLSQGLALDKVMTKMILLQKGIPTPRFMVLEKPDDPLSEALNYPLIVKPKDEAVSYGLKIVHNEVELREGAKNIYDMFKGPTLVEEYIDGQEVNVGLLGNAPVKALPPVELVFNNGDKIFTYEDKSRQTQGRVERVYPANLSDEATQHIQSLAIATFKVLGCFDSARVDFRIDNEGNPYVLEINSMASLSPGGSYVFAAEKAGMDYKALVEKLIEVASKRYFGENIIKDEITIDYSSREKNMIFNHLVNKRDELESDLKFWTSFNRDEAHPLGIHQLIKTLNDKLLSIGLTNVEAFTNSNSIWSWETKEGYENGTLLVLPLDIPNKSDPFHPEFKKEAEWIFGNGIASSNASITCVLKALEGLKNAKKLKNRKIGIFAYSDEGKGMRYSGKLLQQASKLAKEVIIMQPGSLGGKIVNQRRGYRKFNVVIERSSTMINSKSSPTDIFFWFTEKINELKEIIKNHDKLSIAVTDIQSSNNHMMRSHRISASIFLTYIDSQVADKIESEIKRIFRSTSKNIKSYISNIEVRPPMIKNNVQNDLIMRLKNISDELELPFGVDSKSIPSAGGDVAQGIPVVCGMSPSGRNLYSVNESINRLELLQKTVLLAEYLLTN